MLAVVELSEGSVRLVYGCDSCVASDTYLRTCARHRSNCDVALAVCESACFSTYTQAGAVGLICEPYCDKGVGTCGWADRWSPFRV